MIGNTPLLEICCTYQGRCLRIFAKAEAYNLTGSIKDRVAYYILKKAYETGAIEPGMTIAEATSGNTGISFAAVGAALGHPVVIYICLLYTSPLHWPLKIRLAWKSSPGRFARYPQW